MTVAPVSNGLTTWRAARFGAVGLERIAPSTSTTAGPAPLRSKAILVPSPDVTVCVKVVMAHLPITLVLQILRDDRTENASVSRESSTRAR